MSAVLRHCLWLLWAITLPLSAQTVEYIHTDALGSPVAITDANRNVVERSEYEPYGALLNRPLSDGPGYTGHVSDAATGLSYMQQRYYDPGIGRFLSVDPVTANSSTGGNFNRYWYANNNPYRFTDPDGREAADRAYGAVVGYMLRNNPEKLRIWASGEAAATTEGSGAEQGAAIGQAAGEFVDKGDFTGKAIAAAATKGIVTAITRGKYKPGGRFSPSTKRVAAERAGGKCEYCAVKTVPGQKSERGVTPPKNEAATDHIEPRSKGGTNSPDNAAHACRECNGKFSDKLKPPPTR
jgi:RHS repeat-associated protein